jgi:hypothetical protein
VRSSVVWGTGSYKDSGGADILIISTSLFFLLLLATCWILARRMGRRDFLLSGPLALAILIGFQAVLLNVLSLFGAVYAFTLFCGNMSFILAVICVEIRRLGTKEMLREYSGLIKCQVDLWTGRSNPLALLVAPLMLILLLTALVYPPNNWDSMSYHMARVVYWMENGSIAYYPTAINHQNLMSPGAEYVILLLQLLSASDILANLVQFISYYLLISATPSFLRLLGVRRRIANWGLVLSASLPMGVLQATSTQNDLVASCLGLALCMAALRLWHENIRGEKSRLDIMVLALLIAVGWLVKATSILAALPFLLMAAVCYSIALIRRPQWWRGQAFNLLLGVLLVAVVSGPDLYRKNVDSGSFTANRREIFPFNGFWEKKIIHSVVGVNFHVIPTEKFYKGIVMPLTGFFNSSPFPQPREPFLKIHEDVVGNPLHMIFAGVAIILFLLRFKSIPHQSRWSVLFVCISWILLHGTIRGQPWISRLQTPVFMLFPCFLAAWTPRSKHRLVGFGFEALLVALIISCLPYGIIAAVRNQSRPLTLADLWRIDRDSAYYINNRVGESQHAAVIEKAKKLKVKKVGLENITGVYNYDYPLSWRLYRLGIEVRHIRSNLDLEWADIVYAPVPGTTQCSADGEAGSFLVDFRFKKKMFEQIFDFNDINAASPYAEAQRTLPFVVLPGDLVSVNVLSRAPITEGTRAFFMLYQLPRWEETMLFHSHVIADRNSAHMVSITKCRMEKPTLIWRNWGGAILPATRIIFTVWRQTADQGPTAVDRITTDAHEHREENVGRNEGGG